MRAWIAFVLTLAASTVTPLLAQDSIVGSGEQEEEESCTDMVDADGVDTRLIGTSDITIEFTVPFPDLDSPVPFFMYEFIELDYVVHVAYYQTEYGDVIVLMCGSDLEVGG